MTLAAAQDARKRLVEKLAKKSVDSSGIGIDGVGQFNTTEHWQDVGKFHLLNWLLWECDK